MLATRELRPLTLTNATPGRPPHLSAGSGLIRRGDHIYVVGDDELDLAVFRRGDDGPGELVRLFEGALPLEGRERSSAKPDLEAVTVIPPFRFHPHGALLALGSGSKDSRERGFVWSLDEDGALRGFPRVIDVSPLYDFVRRHIEGRLNIEGVAVAQGHLCLFQRGNGVGAENMVLRLSLDEVMTTLISDFVVQAEELASVRVYDLGARNGIDLDFTDGDALPDGRLVFSAAAEEVSESTQGGQGGSVVGIIGVDGAIERMVPLADETLKVEGIDAVASDGLIDLLMCTDADDPLVPSPLLAATLPDAPE